jgi:hypothetical protein
MIDRDYEELSIVDPCELLAHREIRQALFGMSGNMQKSLPRMWGLYWVLQPPTKPLFTKNNNPVSEYWMAA